MNRNLMEIPRFGQTRIIVDIAWILVTIGVVAFLAIAFMPVYDFLVVYQVTSCTHCPDDPSTALLSTWYLWPAVTVAICFLYVVSRAIQQQRGGEMQPVG